MRPRSFLAQICSHDTFGLPRARRRVARLSCDIERCCLFGRVPYTSSVSTHLAERDDYNTSLPEGGATRARTPAARDFGRGTRLCRLRTGCRPNDSEIARTTRS